MALDSQLSFTSDPAPEQPLEEAPLPANEHTPLIGPDTAATGRAAGPGELCHHPQQRGSFSRSPTTAFSVPPETAGIIMTPAPRPGDRRRGGGRRLPQAIAHRGYKAAAPENSMLAFRAAVAAGARAVETDLRLSRDGVVVLSHDATLRRCFGVDARVRDRDWADLAALRSLREPPQPMPRLRDLLEYMNQPGVEDVWVMLDVKIHDDPVELVRRTAETIAEVPGIRPWSERILPCCWSLSYVKLCKEFLPGFPIAHVGFSGVYARALAKHVPSMSVSMIRNVLAAPIIGWRFIRDMKKTGHPIYTWTINDERWMEWSIRKELDGVITDDPKLFLEVCDRIASKETETPARRSAIQSLQGHVRDTLSWARYVPFVIFAMIFYFIRYGLPERNVRKALGSK